MFAETLFLQEAHLCYQIACRILCKVAKLLAVKAGFPKGSQCGVL